VRQCSAAFHSFLDQKSLFSSHAILSLISMPEPGDTLATCAYSSNAVKHGLVPVANQYP
jgi:hypothetical protein